MEYIASPKAAEENAAQKMQELGYLDARTTGGSADAGIDVRSRRAIAQVKWQGAVTSRPDLQRLFGARGMREDWDMLFFSAAGYSKHAVEYADECGICLFTYDPLGTLSASNDRAEELIAEAQTRAQKPTEIVRLGPPRKPASLTDSDGEAGTIKLGATPRSLEAQRNYELRKDRRELEEKQLEERAEGCAGVGCGLVLILIALIGMVFTLKNLLNPERVDGSMAGPIVLLVVCAIVLAVGVLFVRVNAMRRPSTK